MTQPLALIATMILNGGQDLIKQYESIDYPVNRYFVLDNSMGKSPDVLDAIRKIKEKKSKYIKEIVVVTNAMNVGFSGSVNQIIKQNTDCPYWCVLSVDWHPKPNQLQKLAERLETSFTGILCDQTQNGYSALVLTPELLYEVGYLDENFFPAYYEDNDHRYRMKLAGYEWEYLPLEYEHKVSSTLKRSTKIKNKNAYTFKENNKYYHAKWGGPPGAEQYETPFNMDLPLDYWMYDPCRSERQRWI